MLKDALILEATKSCKTTRNMEVAYKDGVLLGIRGWEVELLRTGRITWSGRVGVCSGRF